MSIPKVSVLMPIYNTQEKYLREAVESILSQTYQDFEFIILDDCSTDFHVEQVIKSYVDPRIRYFKNEDNLGISNSRNKLMDLSRGDYLAIMDHDDISLSNRFIKQVEILDLNPEIGVVGSGVYYIEQRKKIKYPTNNSEIEKALLVGCCICHPASMIRKSVIVNNNARYEHRFTPAEDYALWCRLIRKVKFYNIPEVLFHYRDHAENTTNKKMRQIFDASSEIKFSARRHNPDIWEMAKEDLNILTRIKLIGFIPFLKIVRRGDKEKLLLFYFLPLFSKRITTKLDQNIR